MNSTPYYTERVFWMAYTLGLLVATSVIAVAVHFQ